jgi:GNAT superfamily N-acetyltransferase
VSADEHASESQFGPYRIAYDPTGENTAAIRSAGRDKRDRYHSFVAYDTNGEEAGSIAWAKRGEARIPGEIGYVHTHPDNRRTGIATALYGSAVNSGLKPAPKHSPQRTDDGEAWTKAVGGTRPRRKQ